MKPGEVKGYSDAKQVGANLTRDGRYVAILAQFDGEDERTILALKRSDGKFEDFHIRLSELKALIKALEKEAQERQRHHQGAPV